jgi:hypothetical protein
MELSCVATAATITKEVALTLAAIVGAAVAALGLGTWRHQLKGQVEYTLARRILRLCYEYRDAIAAVRHPMMWGSEMPEPPEGTGNLTADQRHFYGRRKAYEARWQKVRSVRAELYPELLETEVLWEQQLADLMNPLFQLEIDLLIAIEDHLESVNPDIHTAEKQHLQDRESIKIRRELLYARFSREDAFDNKFKEGLEAVGQFLKTQLKK